MRESRSDAQWDVQLDFCCGVEITVCDGCDSLEMTVTQSPTNSETRKALKHESALESLKWAVGGEEGKQCCCSWVMRGCIPSLVWDDGAETKHEAEALLLLWDVVTWPLCPPMC